MSQSTTFTTTKPQWFSTPWSKVVYELIEKNSNRTFTMSVANMYTRNTTLKHLTTRPSNKFNGVNYAALNKDNGCRKSFIPRNDKFIELDIGAYHPTLLGFVGGV